MIGEAVNTEVVICSGGAQVITFAQGEEYSGVRGGVHEKLGERRPGVDTPLNTLSMAQNRRLMVSSDNRPWDV